MKDEDQYQLHRYGAFIQPALTALQLALVSLLSARDVRPATVAGLSMGEVAAAFTAGILNLRDAFRIVCCQARIVRSPADGGSMAVVNLTADQTAEYIDKVAPLVSIAVELDPETTVLAGDRNAIGSVIHTLESRGVRCTVLPLADAFHSRRVDPVKNEFFAALSDLKAESGRLPVYSSVTGDRQSGTFFGVDHWWKIMSDRARFASLVKSLCRDGYRTFVEIGPHPVLADSIQRTARYIGLNVSVFSLMKRGENDCTTFDRTVSALPSNGRVFQ
jgi:acyl transferase domain-containing protein